MGNCKKKYEPLADLTTCYGVDALQWTPEQALGMKANMERSYAQQRILAGDYGGHDDELGKDVYNLFLIAYDETTAEEARTRFLESRELKGSAHGQ